MAKSDSGYRNVLVMRLSALGDVAMTIPVLYPVCRANPGIRFVMLTKGWPASMFHDRPDNLMVVGIDVNKEYKGLLGLIRLASSLRRQYDIDAVADLHSVMRTWVIGAWLKLCGLPVVRLDKQRGRRKALVSHKSSEPVTPTIDRLSILALKIWHMREQTERSDADAAHIAKCQAKLNVLLEQRVDLTTAIDQLLDDIAAGHKFMKVYRQMKMYNDPETNPVLYGKK